MAPFTHVVEKNAVWAVIIFGLLVLTWWLTTTAGRSAACFWNFLETILVNQMVVIVIHPYRVVKRMNPGGQNPAFVNHVKVLITAAHDEAGQHMGRPDGPLKVSFIQFRIFNNFQHFVGCPSLPYCVVLEGTTIFIMRDHSLVLDSASAMDFVRSFVLP